MDLRILYCIIVITTLTRYSKGCTREYEDTSCTYILTCDGFITGEYRWNTFVRIHNRYNYYNNIRDDNDNSNCPSGGVVVEGNTLYPVKVIFKEDYGRLQSDVVPYTTYNDLFPAITSLDLSENKYTDKKVIQYMPNLITLNLSRNRLTAAVLSNRNALSHLTNLDLSYNTIHDIKVNTNEYVYKTLTNINLSNNYLVKIPDAVFEDLDNLQHLDLSNNYIETLSPVTFEGMKKLVDLNLSNNRLTEINSSLFRFSNLNTLNLSGNKLENLTLTDFQQMINLITLDLSSNLIKALHANTFDSMTLLQTLNLRDNKLETLNKDTFINLRSLNSIDLSKNEIKQLPIGLFRNTNITSFAINENLLEGSIYKGMFGLNVTELDLSNQFLTEIKDYAFYDLIRLESLLLNSNSIQKLENLCFKTLMNLTRLDLSFNQITSLTFNKEDLSKVLSLALKNNRLTVIKQEELIGLNNLEYLDISDNLISHLEINSFNILNNLINLKINNNPLVNSLQGDTFHGLISLPDLDISNSMLTEIQNASFDGMIALSKLNMSRCTIHELQYNAFIDTGYIETLDLSFNQIQYFFINMTELVNLRTLLLNNNRIASISGVAFNGLLILSNLTLSHNMIQNMNDTSFDTLIDLRNLDLSYNENLNFTVKVLQKLIRLNTLILSGVKTPMSFKDLKENSSNIVLIMSNASIQNISDLSLNKMTLLSTLCMSINNVSNLVIGDFSGLTSLLFLDLSFNKISYIQPGVFKENSLLTALNISHNYLFTLNYGIFRGLIYLETLDISYNKINNLDNERFYEVQSLAQLIVDFNEIKSINAEEFTGTALRKLSIGNNPLPCQMIVNLKKKDLPFIITAIKVDEHSNENIDGIICNTNETIPGKVTISEGSDKSNVLQNTLLNLVNTFTEREDKNYRYLEKISDEYENISNLFNLTLPNINNASISLSKISDKLEKILNELNLKSNINKNSISISNISSELGKISNFLNATSIINNNIFSLFNKSINLLDRIPAAKVSGTTISTPVSRVMTTSQTNKSAPDEINNKNNSYVNETANIISYINKIKEELQNTIAIERENIKNEIGKKIISDKLLTELNGTTSVGPYQLTSNNNNNEHTYSIFTEICVGLILLILVVFILYKFYKSLLTRKTYSLSTRELPDSMDNSSL